MTPGSGGGAVDSVNGKTGAVVLNAEDVQAVAQDQGAENSGKFLKVGADGQVFASSESAGGGLTSVSHDETLAGAGTDADPLRVVGGGSSLPDQTGHAGQFLTTNGTTASWDYNIGVLSATGPWGGKMEFGTIHSGFGDMLSFTASSSTNIGGFEMYTPTGGFSGQVLSTSANQDYVTGATYNTLDVCAMNASGNASGFVCRLDEGQRYGTVELYMPKTLSVDESSNLVPTTSWVQEVVSQKSGGTIVTIKDL